MMIRSCLGLLSGFWWFSLKSVRQNVQLFFATIFEWVGVLSSDQKHCQLWVFLYRKKYVARDGVASGASQKVIFTKKSKNYKIENVYLFSFQQFSSTPRGVDSVTSICCDREIPKADNVFDPRQNGLCNKKWLQKKVLHRLRFSAGGASRPARSSG